VIRASRARRPWSQPNPTENSLVTSSEQVKRATKLQNAKQSLAFPPQTRTVIPFLASINDCTRPKQPKNVDDVNFTIARLVEPAFVVLMYALRAINACSCEREIMQVMCARILLRMSRMSKWTSGEEQASSGTSDVQPHLPEY
jgi:hypothetical protein